MICLLLIVLGAVCNAIMDTVTHHYNISIFSKYNRLWWDPLYSWKNKYVDRDVKKGLVKKPFYTNYSDAWHLFKSAMIILLLSLPIAYHITDPLTSSILGMEFNYLFGMIDLAIFGATWILVFNICYNRVFKIK